MSDGFPKVPAQASPPASATASTTASYARIYEEQQPRLVAYARSLTRNNTWAAEDLVAEAHFRVWRRLSEGHEIENVPAYLMTTVRHLAASAVGEARETPHDPSSAERTDIAVHAADSADPAEQVSSVDLLVRVLGQLPERWVRALWLAEAEGQPLETVGQRIGAKQGATAVLLHRAREGMRQAFLRNQTGAPDDPACEVHWVRMPAYVRGSATPRQSERLLAHVDACDDCRGRLAVLMRANDRLPALVGPALLVFAVGGAGKFLLPFAAGSAAATTALSGQLGSALHTARQAVTGGGGAKVPTAIAAGATVAGAALAMMIALGVNDPSPTPLSPRVPLAETPVAARPSEGPVAAAQAPERSGGVAAVEARAEQDGQRGVDGGAGDAGDGGGGDGGDGGGGAALAVDAAGSDTAVSGPVAAGGSAPEPVADAEGEADAETDAPDVNEPAPPVAEPAPEPPAAEPPSQEEPAPGGDEPSPSVPVPVPADPVGEQPGEPAPENPGYEEPGQEEPGQVEPGAEAPSTPIGPGPVEETPGTTQPAPEPVPAPVPEPTPAPDPAPAPQPAPGDPGNDCGN
ncbi:sigma-70 family RNA polymerase sigma factor [Streptomyces bicolor]|uniref:sigma-70 family RNA polymerase sigma factor n=1 Tax=Streptomyces bicolor TaxID=66874 RepID=UPI000690A632|nr:sigma-70 family RNA polymerase sigma factor [Streptomyces bicolor]